MTVYERLRPFIYRLSPEQAHHLTIRALGLGGLPGLPELILKKWMETERPNKPVSVMGLNFPNAVGMAAGYDKDAEAFNGLACLGFGHIEVGTVTPKGQPGNPKPRLFRLVKDEAIINRMGFNNQGADKMINRLCRRKKGNWVLGVNIGKNKNTPNEEAADDYRILVEKMAPYADYLAVNVSSPNTPGLRDLQARQALTKILGAAKTSRDAQIKELGRRVPLVLKLSPDLGEQGLDDALQCAIDADFDAIIITNTTIRRDGLQDEQAGEVGGLSGKPLQERSLLAVAETVHRLNGALPVIASGGVMTPLDVIKRLDAGAVLVQLYSGMIYYGPTLVRDSLTALSA